MIPGQAAGRIAIVLVSVALVAYFGNGLNLASASVTFVPAMVIPLGLRYPNSRIIAFLLSDFGGHVDGDEAPSRRAWRLSLRYIALSALSAFLAWSLIDIVDPLAAADTGNTLGPAEVLLLLSPLASLVFGVASFGYLLRYVFLCVARR